MSNCLITKLKGIVNNPSLPKIDELVIQVNSNTPLYIDSFVSCRVVNGYLSNESFSANLGTSMGSNNGTIFVTGGSTLFLSPKNKVSQLWGNNKSSVTINVEDLAYIGNLPNFKWMGGCVVGNIDALKDKPFYSFGAPDNPGLYGNLSSILNPNIVLLNLARTAVKGNVYDFINCKSLDGNVAMPSKISGDLSIFNSEFPNVTMLTSENSSPDYILTGDMSKLNSKIEFLSFSGHTTNFTWKGTKGGKIIACDNCNFGNDLDAFLNNMADLEAGTYKTISVIGTRTSASDAAVATLQQKGYTVSVTPA
nr:MAG TPA: hypothetical protein [Caudoviricetes sp.]